MTRKRDCRAAAYRHDRASELLLWSSFRIKSDDPPLSPVEKSSMKAQEFGRPDAENHYLHAHVARLAESFKHWTGKDLVALSLSPEEQAHKLFYAPFVVLSHNTAADPILNYANEAGLRLFELTWSELIAMPSRLTAEMLARAERARLLLEVSRNGFIDDYRGVRVTRSGRRFLIERATVWNLFDRNGVPYGQAAMFGEWRFLD